MQIVVGNGLEKPDSHFIDLWKYLERNTPDTNRIIILNRTKEAIPEWNMYDNNTIFCIGMGEVIDEETAQASKNDIMTVVDYVTNKYE